MLKSKGLNTAHVAEAAELDRSRVRRILSGSEAMTVDELMKLSDALELDPQELTGQQLPESVLATAEEPASDDPRIDPFGNHPEQLFRVAFGLGCTFLFVARTDALGDSGIPATVLGNYRDGKLPIRLEAAYHKYNEPRYADDGITLTLSFDALYDCWFPWSSIEQFVLYPIPPDPAPETTDEEPAAVPHLRLVT
jgi:plasmid maintenance system antidote protein VapI